MNRKVRAANVSVQKNELNGRDVITEPPAKPGPKGKYSHMSDEELKAAARSMVDKRSKLREKEPKLYYALYKRKLLDETFGKLKCHKRGNLTSEIIETAEKLEKEEKLEGTVKCLSETDRRILDMLLKNQGMRGRKMAEKAGISYVTFSVHKGDILAHLKGEPPPRRLVKYADASDDEIREMIRETGLETPHRIYLINQTLAREIYYRQKYLDADYSDAFKRRVNAEERKLRDVLDKLLETKEAEEVLENLFDDEKIIVENALSDTPKSMKEMGLKAGYLGCFANRLPSMIECTDVKGRTRKLRKTFRKVLEHEDKDRIMDSLSAAEKTVIRYHGMSGNPPTLEETGERMSISRERVRQMIDEIEKKLKLALNGGEHRRKTSMTKDLKELRRLAADFSKRDDADTIVMEHFSHLETSMLLFRGLGDPPVTMKEMAKAVELNHATIKRIERIVIGKLTALERKNI